MKKLQIIAFIVITIVIANFTYLSNISAYPSFPQQENNFGKKAIRNINEAISSMLISSDPLIKEQGKKLQSFAFDLNPTVYLSNGEIKNPFNKPPVCVESDIATLDKLYEINRLYDKVEFILIRIENESDLGFILNLNGLASFQNLKFICITSSIKFCQDKGCEAGFISNKLEGIEQTNFNIYYSIAVSE